MINNFRNNSQQYINKRKTWLWVLGWLFVFPIPLMIILFRNDKIRTNIKSVIIAVAWFLYLCIAFTSTENVKKDNNSNANDLQTVKTISRNNESKSNKVERTKEKKDITESSSEEINITEIHFSDINDVTLKVGEKTKTNTVQVKHKNSRLYSSDDILLVSVNPDIANITHIQTSYGKSISFEIEGIKPGETFIYATSKDNSVSSEKIKVKILEPVEVESVNIELVNYSIPLDEKIQATAIISPDNADNQELVWTSSDMNVATINDSGIITAVGGGTATITAITSNGVLATADISVDGSKRLMNVNVSHIQDTDINIGNEWSYITQINGNPSLRAILVTTGETLTCYAKFTESDDNPDIGEASKTYTVTEEDILNGFKIMMDLYVTENAGRNRGKTAHFVVTYNFTFPKE